MARKNPDKRTEWDQEADTIKLLRKAHSNIKQKCSNPKDPQYKNYGGRGIQFQEDWAAQRERFVRLVYEEIGPKPSPTASLDRIDNDGHYASGNLRWASKQDQAINRRSSVSVTVDDRDVRRAEMARDRGIPSGTLAKQFQRAAFDARIKLIEDLWRQNLEKRGQFAWGFSAKERRAVADMLKRLREEVELSYIVQTVIHYWKEFGYKVLDAKDIEYYPPKPSVEFFAAHFDVAVAFTRRKVEEWLRSQAKIEGKNYVGPEEAEELGIEATGAPYAAALQTFLQIGILIIPQ